MKFKDERAIVMDFGFRMVRAGLTTGTGGNLSVMDRRQGVIIISPSGVPYDQMLPEDVVVVDPEGHLVEGHLKPSSELGFHLALYRARADVHAVVHTHSPYATTLACLGWEIPAVHYLVGFSGNKVPVAPYATFGTHELAENTLAAIGNYNAVLLANHGLVAVGPTMTYAFSTAEEIEFVARIYYQTRSLGSPQILPETEMERVMEKFKTYGQKG